MHQVLFWIPIKTSWTPDGIPLYAYGAMLFVTFVTSVWLISRRAVKTGHPVPRERIQDMAIVLFVVGLAGARLTYMLQFHVPLRKFFRIWEGGIVLLGGIIGGAIAFIVFHYYVLRRFNVTLWQMADVIAPALAIGIALGRIGCLMNGCCWGNVAGASCPAIEFPLLTSPSREMLVDRDGLQTVTGFLIEKNRENPDDVRSIVGKIEPGSAAEEAGLKVNDRIVKLKVAGDWKSNGEVLTLSGPPDAVSKVVDAMKEYGSAAEVDPIAPGEMTVKITVEKPEMFGSAYDLARSLLSKAGRNVLRTDVLGDMLNSWPRGRNSVQFVVERDGQEVELPAFTPRGIGLHPTQIYETISMILLFFLVIAFYPFRRHDGQVFVVWMIAYSFHRFLNEILRTEPVEGFDMTLSQNLSVLMLLAAIGMEIYLRKTQLRRSPQIPPLAA